MHVPDGFMNVTMSAATGVISFGTLWAYIRSAKDLIADKFIALTGMMSALIFVLQMINFPIAAGTSGHLLGGALAVIVLGPRLGLICLSVVVIIQSLLFADLIYAHNVPKLITPVAADIVTFMNPSGTCIEKV